MKYPIMALAKGCCILGTVLFCLQSAVGCQQTGVPSETGDRTVESGTNGGLSVDSRYMLLVNKTHVISEFYQPDSLVTMDKSLTNYGKEVQLETTVAQAAEAMLRELWACGYTDVVITSGYRSYSYQSVLFNTYLGQEQSKHPDWSAERCRQEVLTYSALPGTSEHQTGLCMDLIIINGQLDESFAQHAAYQWLCDNAHRFGFILRFPKGKENITGYSYEPWHYRYVGVTAATDIHDRRLTLEEYLGQR